MTNNPYQLIVKELLELMVPVLHLANQLPDRTIPRYAQPVQERHQFHEEKAKDDYQNKLADIKENLGNIYRDLQKS